MHNDFILMTLVFAVPVLILTIARYCYYASRGFFGNSDDDGISAAFGLALITIAAISYMAYYISFLISLFISRIREYYADEHAGELTEDPNTLSTALVKIAYGLLIEGHVEENKRSNVRGLSGFGIFNPKGAASLAASSADGTGNYSKNIIQAAAAWDLFNPWAKYFQLFSTHPLPAKRIMRLNDQCNIYGITPEIDLTIARKIKEKQAGKSLFPEFLTDVSIKLLPLLMFVALVFLTVVLLFSITGLIDLGSTLPLNSVLPYIILLWAFGFLLIGFCVIIKIKFKYKKGYEPKNVAELVSYVKASPIRTVPAILEGTIIGRGIPGYYFGEDLYFRDNTGLMYIDYRFGLSIVDFFWAIRTAKKLIGQKVRIIGWYRRGPGPYLQVDTIETETGKRYRNYCKHLTYIWAIIAFGIAIILFYVWYSMSPTGFFGLF